MGYDEIRLGSQTIDLITGLFIVTTLRRVYDQSKRKRIFTLTLTSYTFFFSTPIL
jgi:hypothetical protein